MHMRNMCIYDIYPFWYCIVLEISRAYNIKSIKGYFYCLFYSDCESISFFSFARAASRASLHRRLSGSESRGNASFISRTMRSAVSPSHRGIGPKSWDTL